MIQWIRSWWKADRIRFTPGHCQLFQWVVGSRVLVRDRLWQVTERIERVTDSEVLLDFHLSEMDVIEPVSACLSVRVATSKFGPPIVLWRGKDWEEELFGEDVVILKSEIRN